jgi:hypothetical protein
MTTHYIRVRNKVTRHELDLPKQSFNPDKYEKLNSSRYPETTRPRRPKPNVLKRRTSEKIADQKKENTDKAVE